MQYHNIYSDTERSSSLTIGYYKCNITTCLFTDSERSSPLRWHTIHANALPLTLLQSICQSVEQQDMFFRAKAKYLSNCEISQMQYYELILFVFV